MTEQMIAKRRKRIRKVSLETVRQSLSDRLPFFMQHVATDYEAFCQQEMPEDAKGVAAHHAACKAALSHLEVLTKLTRWADGDQDTTPDAAEEDDFSKLVQGAQAALQGVEDSL